MGLFDFLKYDKDDPGVQPSPELAAVQEEYLRVAATLWAGTDPVAPEPLKDRDIFDLLGFD